MYRNAVGRRLSHRLVFSRTTSDVVLAGSYIMWQQVANSISCIHQQRCTREGCLVAFPSRNYHGSVTLGVRHPYKDSGDEESTRERKDNSIQLTSLTQSLLREEDFTKWDNLANLDRLIRDWEDFTKKNHCPTLTDVTLFSNLCLRISECAASYDLRLRAVQGALVAWTFMAKNNSSEAVLTHARQLFDSMPSPPQNYQNRRANALEQRKGLYRLLFLVYSWSDHPEAAARCHVLLQQLLEEDSGLIMPERPSSQMRKGNNPDDSETLISQSAFHWTLRAAAKKGDEALYHLVHGRMNQEGWNDTAVTYDCLLMLLETLGTAEKVSKNHHPHRNIQQEALQSWRQLLQHYRQVPSSQWEPLSATLGKLLFLHKNEPRSQLEILTDALLFVKEYPACGTMVGGSALRIVLTTMVVHRRPDFADKIGRTMFEAYIEGALNLKPTSEHFALLIRAQTNAGDLQKAKEYLDWMEASEQIDSSTYNVYLRGLLEHQNDPVPDMEGILERMTRHSNGKSAARDVATYLTLMNGWVKSKRPGYVYKVDEIFRLSQASVVDRKQLPDEIYGVVLNTWAVSRLPEAADRCQGIFEDIPVPTIVHYNMLLKAYVNCGLAEKAEALYRKMLSGSDVQIDRFSLDTVVFAWTRAGQTNRALALVQLTVAANPQTDALSHLSIERILQSEPKRVVKTAENLWESLHDMKLGYRRDLLLPIIYGLGEEERNEAAWHAIQECLDVSQAHGTLSAEVLVAALASCVKLFPDQEEDAHKVHVTKLFQKCCDDGHVNHEVLEAFRNCLSPAHYRRLTMQDPRRTCDLKMIPENWKRRAVCR